MSHDVYCPIAKQDRGSSCGSPVVQIGRARMNAIQRQTCRKKIRVGSLCFLFTNYFARAILVLLVLGTARAQSANSGETLSIAASSNLIYALDELNRTF